MLGLGLVLALGAALPGCRSGERAGRGARGDACREAYERQDWPAAEAICARQAGERGDRAASTRAAWAAVMQADHAAAQRHVDALGGVGDDPERAEIQALVRAAEGADDAEAWYKRAAEGYVRANQRGRAASVVSSWADLAYRDGRLREAYDAADEARPWAVAAGDVQTVVLLDLTRVQTAYEAGHLRRAERALAQAEALPELSDAFRASLAADRGLLHQAEGRGALARRSHEAAVRFAAASDDPLLGWNTRMNLVQLLIAEGDLVAARALLVEIDALASAPGLGTANSRAMHRYVHGLVARREGRLDDAARELDAALAVATLDDQIWELASVRAEIAEALGERAAALGFARTALAAVDRARGGRPLGELGVSLVSARGKPYQLVFELAAQLGHTDEALAVLDRFGAAVYTDAFAAAADAADPADAAWGAGLAALGPHLELAATARAGAPGVVTGARWPVVAYFEGRTRWWRAVVVRGVTTITPIDGAPAELARLVAEVRRDPAAAAAATDLGERLWPAGAAAAASFDRLVIVPSPTLASVPFAALQHRGRRWIEHRIIAVAPTLRMATGAAPAPGAAPASAAVPVFIGDPRGNLPGARDEARGLAERHGGHALLGAEATRARVTGLSAPLVHLAAHTGEDGDGPWLELADGRLGAAGVVGLAWRADTIVLASCASGASPRFWGSLGALLLAGGARVVLASLWPVEDAPTRAFIETVYAQGLVRGDAAAALATAQRAAIAAGLSPRVWAAFVVYQSGGK